MDGNTEELLRFLKEGGFPELTLDGDAREDYKKHLLLIIPLLLCLIHIPFVIFAGFLVYIEAQFYNFVYKLLKRNT